MEFIRSLMTVTPEERAEDVARAKAARIDRGLPVERLPPPPPGFVRVCWWASVANYCDRGAELEANVPLEEDGSLEVSRIEEMWGLKDCAVINLARREIVETRNEGTLSRLAVGLLLMDRDFICVLEQLTDQDIMRRALYKYRRDVLRDTVRPPPHTMALFMGLALCAITSLLADTCLRVWSTARVF